MSNPRDLIVGRDGELADLSNALKDAVDGHGQITMLSGEPGIGKSRPAEELAQRADAARTVALRRTGHGYR
jgi:predicted ATPase